MESFYIPFNVMFLVKTSKNEMLAHIPLISLLYLNICNSDFIMLDILEMSNNNGLEGSSKGQPDPSYLDIVSVGQFSLARYPFLSLPSLQSNPYYISVSKSLLKEWWRSMALPQTMPSLYIKARLHCQCLSFIMQAPLNTKKL